MRTVGTLDPALFTVIPHVAVLDTFELRNDTGSFVANITEAFLDRLVEHMNAREAETGDLSPLVIGHTAKHGSPETVSPPVVGYARNWHKGVLGDTERPCAFIDAWVFNTPEAHEQVRTHGSRRSCELYVDRYEADPISLLGSTTPARDLGLMILSRNGSLSVQAPGDMHMPDEEKPKANETGKAKGEDGKLDQVLAMLGQLMEALTGAGGGAQGQPGMSDEEFEQMLHGPQSRAGEEPVKNSAGYAGGNDTHVQLSRANAEIDALKLRLSRDDLSASLKGIADKKQFTWDDTLVSDLLALPEELRKRQLSRLEALAPARLDAQPERLQRALDAATTQSGPKKMDAAAVKTIATEALAKGTSFETAAKAAGYLS